MKLGFIGCGNMAQAIMKGILGKGLYAKEEIIAADHSEEALKRAEAELGVSTSTDNCQAAQADIILLAVKPFHFKEVIPEISGEVLQAIRRLAQQKMTMVIVTHEMGFAREVASHVMFMDNGLIEEEGPPETVFGAPKSPRLQSFLKAVR